MLVEGRFVSLPIINFLVDEGLNNQGKTFLCAYVQNFSGIMPKRRNSKFFYTTRSSPTHHTVSRRTEKGEKKLTELNQLKSNFNL